MQTQAGEQSVQSWARKLPCCGSPQGLTLGGRTLTTTCLGFSLTSSLGAHAEPRGHRAQQTGGQENRNWERPDPEPNQGDRQVREKNLRKE